MSKHTFHSELYQEQGSLDASRLFADAEKALADEKMEKGMERLTRNHPLQHLVNSTSGGYVSPTAMKSFELCPAGYVFSKLVKEKTGSATSVGRSFHTIMEKFYSADGPDRTIDLIRKITEEEIEESQQTEKADDIREYVNRYWQSLDPLTGAPMNHQMLQCATEQFIKPVINPLGVNLGVPVYTLIDRIDVREGLGSSDGIYVNDYKTGFGDPNPYLLGEHGYLPQMIFYKWAVEAEYGEPVKGVNLICPGADTLSLRYVPMNVNSLVEQSKVVEQVVAHLDHARRCKENRVYETSLMRYCGSCQMKWQCWTYLHEKRLDESKMAKTIPVELEWTDEEIEDGDN